jgi:alpha-galactosidase
MMRTLLLGLVTTTFLSAAITFDEDRKLFLLETSSSTYVVGVNERGELQNLFWGGALSKPSTDFAAAHSIPERSSFDPSQSRTREEFPAWGGTRFNEPAVKITRADGDRDVVLHYRSHKINGDSLDIETADIKDNILVVLHYRVYP